MDPHPSCARRPPRLAGTDQDVATGITSIHGRDPVAARAAQATPLDAYPDRFLLGLGVSHRPLVERFRGGDYGSPLADMRAYLDGMDAFTPVAAGGEHPAPRVVAALGPRMLELAAERCAGAHPYLVTPARTASARDTLGPRPRAGGGAGRGADRRPRDRTAASPHCRSTTSASWHPA